MKNTVVPEVIGYVTKCSFLVGKAKEEEFEQFMSSMFSEISSPIEQLLYVAMQATASLNLIDEINETVENGVSVRRGLWIQPQVQIGKYRVDFLVSWLDEYEPKHVVVECDSQQFHERTEKERRYEKARDRHLLTAGYNSLHFTGSEIMEHPFRVASEVVSCVTQHNNESLLEIVNNYIEAFGE